MKILRREYSRRELLRFAGTALAGIGASRLVGHAADGPPRRKTVLSFYCDDTSPYVAGAKAVETFLNYCADQGVAGEATCLLGARGYSICRNPNEEERAFVDQVRRAWSCGVDTHVELMTHRGLFDFQGNREPDGAAHEGLWLYEPNVTVEQYEQYIGAILNEGQRVDLMFTGLTWPGCGCSVCQRRHGELRAGGHTAPNPALWQALLNLARKGKFRGRTVPCFFDSSETNYGLHQKASEGQYGVYDLMPNTLDHFGIWENNPKRVDPDYYITADGTSGAIVRHVQAGAPYCVWYAHWQGLNPAKGVGWPAFTTVVERVQKHLAGRVVWMRPSDITARFHAAGGWSFLDSL
jgi:hypothetical protein